MLKVCGYYASVGDSLTSGMHYDSRQNDSNAHTKKLYGHLANTSGKSVVENASIVLLLSSVFFLEC